MYGIKKESNFILFLWVYSFLRTVCRKDYFFPLSFLGTFVESQLTINMKVYFLSLNSNPLMYKSILMLVHTVLIPVAQKKVLKLGSEVAPKLFF